MLSRYSIITKVVELGGFTKAAEAINYSQSAVSQTVKNFEHELGFALLSRGKDGVHLTKDGEAIYPYIQAIAKSEDALSRRVHEIKGLTNSELRIGTFTSVSRTLLPGWMRGFKETYPEVRFVLEQGEYTTIPEWVKTDTVDFGFVNMDATPEMDSYLLYTDDMVAVLPLDQPQTKKEVLTLEDLSHESLILLDEGNFNVPLQAFARHELVPQVAFEVYDDYTILAMVEENLGVSIMYARVLNGFDDKVAIRPIKEKLSRRVGIIWKNWDKLPLAARHFIDYIKEQSM